MNVEDHKLQPIGAMPLHPVEAVIVAAVTDAGHDRLRPRRLRLALPNLQHRRHREDTRR